MRVPSPGLNHTLLTVSIWRKEEDALSGDVNEDKKGVDEGEEDERKKENRY